LALDIESKKSIYYLGKVGKSYTKTNVLIILVNPVDLQAESGFFRECGGIDMLELRDVCVAASSGDSEIEIVNHISLSLDKGKIYVITGPNGGGKTSLAKAIMGIYPLSGGSIFLDGEDISNMSITERANVGIGYAFQSPTRFKGLKVRDILTIAAGKNRVNKDSESNNEGISGSNSGSNNKAGSESVNSGNNEGVNSENGVSVGNRVSEGVSGGNLNAAVKNSGRLNEIKLNSLLVDVGLCAQDYIDRELDTSFSGGELKRIEIATILARDLRVALFDEPEAGIDLWSFQRLTETFRQLNEVTQTTIIIISHQERILRLADEVILITRGKVTDITTPEKLLGKIDYTATDCDCPNCIDRKEPVLAAVKQ